MRSIHLLPCLALLMACGNDGSTGTTTGTTTGDARSATAPGDPGRDEWQKPGVIFELMGGVGGKTVADLFAGDGYMTRNLLGAGANVIAITNTAAEAEALEKWKSDQGLGDDRLKIRTATSGDPGIGMEEADMALCMHHYTQIQDRGAFFFKVRQGLKAPKVVYIVDFLKTQTPVGPPIETRVGETQVMDELEPSGFTDIGAYTLKLPYQYVVIGQDFVPGPDTPGGDSLLVQ